MTVTQFIWNIDMTRKIKLSLIKELTISPLPDSTFEVIGWLSDAEPFRLKHCEKKEGAVTFIDALTS